MRAFAALLSALLIAAALVILVPPEVGPAGSAEGATAQSAYIWLPRTACNFIKTPSEEFEILLNVTWSDDPALASDVSARLEYGFYDNALSYALEVLSFKAANEQGLWALKVKAPSNAVPGLIYDLRVDIAPATALTETRCIQIISAYKSDLKLMHLTDVHIDYAESGVVGAPVPTAQDMMENIIDEVNIINPDLVLVTGDLVFRGYGAGVGPDIKEQFRMYREAMSGLNAPVCTTIGNHEVEWNADVEETTTNYVENIGPLHWGFDYGNVHFLLLNSTTDYWQDSRLEGGFSTEELDWCEARLGAIPAGELTIVGFHHDYDALERSGGQEMKDLLEANSDKVKYVLNGHSHNDGLDEHGGVKYLQTLSCGENDGSGENGYRLLAISSGVVTDHSYAQTGFGSIPYGLLDATLSIGPSGGVAASIVVENGLQEGYNGCSILLEIDQGKEVAGVNCTVEEVISSSSKSLLRLGFDVKNDSTLDMRLDYAGAADDDVAADDDTNVTDDDIEPDDDTDDDDIVDDDTNTTDDDADDDAADDDAEASAERTVVIAMIVLIAILIVVIAVLLMVRGVSRKGR